MYRKYYYLKKNPFSFTADPAFTYETKNFSNAFFHLLYGIERMEGIVTITGNIGTGKTMLCNFFVNKLRKEKKNFLISFSDPLSLENKIENIYNMICNGDFSDIKLDKSAISYDVFRKFLMDLSETGKKAILIIDEADKLSIEMLQHISLISNIEKDGKKLLQIVLVGEVNLLEKLDLPELGQLNQRISVKYRMEELKKSETEKYINYRIKIAGDDGMITFTPKTINSIYRYTGGCQRLVNLVCDRALLKGMVSRTPVINKSIINHAIKTLNDSNKSFFSKTLDRFNNAYGAFALSLCLMALGASLYASNVKFDVVDPERMSVLLPVEETIVVTERQLPVKKNDLPAKVENLDHEVLASVERKEVPEIVAENIIVKEKKEVVETINKDSNNNYSKYFINKFLLSAGLSAKNSKDEVNTLNENVLVSVRSARLRKSPSLESPIIQLVRGGVLLKKLEVGDGWTKVLISGKDEYGWISNSIINSDPERYLKKLVASAGGDVLTFEQPVQDNPDEVFVNVMVGRIRKSPSLYSDILTRKEFGTIFKKVENNGAWTKVEISMDDKKYGWIKNTIIRNNPGKVINDFLVSNNILSPSVKTAAYSNVLQDFISDKAVLVSVSMARIRAKPSLISNILTRKKFGTVLQKIGDEGMWTKVMVPELDENVGWIHKSIIRNGTYLDGI